MEAHLSHWYLQRDPDMLARMCRTLWGLIAATMLHEMSRGRALNIIFRDFAVLGALLATLGRTLLTLGCSLSLLGRSSAASDGHSAPKGLLWGALWTLWVARRPALLSALGCSSAASDGHTAPKGLLWGARWSLGWPGGSQKASLHGAKSTEHSKFVKPIRACSSISIPLDFHAFPVV